MPDFNIPRIIKHLSNLQKLWINSPEPQKVKATAPNTKSTFKTVSATDLRKEMTGKLPLKLREITIGGKGFTSLSEDILKVQYRSLLIYPLLLFDIITIVLYCIVLWGAVTMVVYYSTHSAMCCMIEYVFSHK